MGIAKLLLQPSYRVLETLVLPCLFQIPCDLLQSRLELGSLVSVFLLLFCNLKSLVLQLLDRLLFLDQVSVELTHLLSLLLEITLVVL